MVKFWDAGMEARLNERLADVRRAALAAVRFNGRVVEGPRLEPLCYVRERLFFVEVAGIRLAVMALTEDDAVRVAEFLVWKETAWGK